MTTDICPVCNHELTFIHSPLITYGVCKNEDCDMLIVLVLSHRLKQYKEEGRII